MKKVLFCCYMCYTDNVDVAGVDYIKGVEMELKFDKKKAIIVITNFFLY